MQLKPGKYTVESFARARGISRQGALNLLSKLKRQGYMHVSGGGQQKRIYTITKLPQQPTNGFYSLVNMYSPEKLQPKYRHIVHGRYTIEQAIIDGILLGDSRTRAATMHLFRHVSNWKRLFTLAQKQNIVKEVRELYKKARAEIRVKHMPKRYQ